MGCPGLVARGQSRPSNFSGIVGWSCKRAPLPPSPRNPRQFGGAFRSSAAAPPLQWDGCQRRKRRTGTLPKPDLTAAGWREFGRCGFPRKATPVGSLPTRSGRGRNQAGGGCREGGEAFWGGGHPSQRGTPRPSPPRKAGQRPEGGAWAWGGEGRGGRGRGVRQIKGRPGSPSATPALLSAPLLSRGRLSAFAAPLRIAPRIAPAPAGSLMAPRLAAAAAAAPLLLLLLLLLGAPPVSALRGPRSSVGMRRAGKVRLAVASPRRASRSGAGLFHRCAPRNLRPAGAFAVGAPAPRSLLGCGAPERAARRFAGQRCEPGALRGG